MSLATALQQERNHPPPGAINRAEDPETCVQVPSYSVELPHFCMLEAALLRPEEPPPAAKVLPLLGTIGVIESKLTSHSPYGHSPLHGAFPFGIRARPTP